MRNLIFISILYALTLSARAQTGYNFARLDSLLAEALPIIEGDSGGFSLTLLKEDEIIYSKVLGPDFSQDKVIPIASASKWVSAALIMILKDEGLLSLDDSLSKYLPDFYDERGSITIRQLLSHTAGFSSASGFTNERSLTLEEAVNLMAQFESLEIQPGTGFIYGDVSMHIAGRIAEVASGKDWQKLFLERIAGPLDMTLSDYQGLGETENYNIARGMRSSADDYMKFLRMILNNGEAAGTQLLSAESIAEMERDQTNNLPIIGTIYSGYEYLSESLHQLRYGLGVWLEEKDSTDSRGIDISSQGVYGFSPWIDRERKLAGILALRGSFYTVMPYYLQIKTLVKEIIDTSYNTTGIEAGNKLTMDYKLFQNYPNPFNPSTIIQFTLPVNTHVTIKIYDLIGREITTLVDEFKNSGSHKVTFNGANLSSGVYFCQLIANGYIDSKKLILLK